MANFIFLETMYSQMLQARVEFPILTPYYNVRTYHDSLVLPA